MTLLEGLIKARVWADGCFLQVVVRDEGVFPGLDGGKFRRWDGRKQFHDPELLLVEKLPWLLNLLLSCGGEACV